MLEDLTSADGFESYTTANGQEVMDTNDAIKANKVILKQMKAGYETPDLGERKLQPNGIFYERTLTKGKVGVNLDAWFSNRYRRVVQQVQTGVNPKTKEPIYKQHVQYEVVRDYLAIKQQATGRIHSELLVAFVIEQKNVGKGKKIVCKHTKMITDKEFVTEFTQELPRKDMLAVFEGLQEFANNATTVIGEESKLMFE